MYDLYIIVLTTVYHKQSTCELKVDTQHVLVQLRAVRKTVERGTRLLREYFVHRTMVAISRTQATRTKAQARRRSECRDKRQGRMWVIVRIFTDIDAVRQHSCASTMQHAPCYHAPHRTITWYCRHQEPTLLLQTPMCLPRVLSVNGNPRSTYGSTNVARLTDQEWIHPPYGFSWWHVATSGRSDVTSEHGHAMVYAAQVRALRDQSGCAPSLTVLLIRQRASASPRTTLAGRCCAVASPPTRCQTATPLTMDCRPP